MVKFLFILFISLAVFSSYAKVQYQFTTTTYEIKANNIDDLLIKVQQNGPKLKQHNSWAVLSWDLNTEYHFISNQQGCQLIADQISIIAEVTLPYWKNIDDNNPSVRKWWKKFTDFIKIHEDKHFTNVYKIASALEINIINMTPSINCKTAKQKYLRLKHQQLDILDTLDNKIDRKAKLAFYSNKELLQPLKQGISIYFESGGMRSYIGM